MFETGKQFGISPKEREDGNKTLQQLPGDQQCP